MLKQFVRFVRLFERKYSIYLSLLFISSIIAGFFEVMGVALIIPFIALIKNPNIVETNQVANSIYSYFQFSDPQHMIYFVALLMGGIFIFKNIYTIAHRYIEFSFIMSWKNRVVRDLMEQYMRQPFTFHLQRNSSSLMRVLGSEIEFTFQNFILHFTLMTSNMIIAGTLLCFVAYLFFIPSLFAGTILIFLMSLQILFIRKISKSVNEGHSKAREENIASLQKSIFAVRESKAFLKEDIFIQEYSTSNKKISKFDHLMSFTQYFPPSLTEIVLIITVLSMACLIIYQNGLHHDEITSLAILAVIAFRIAPAINRCLYSYSRIKTSQKSIDNIIKEITASAKNMESFSSIKRLPFKKEITLKDVSFSYDESTVALKKINLKIPKGSFYGVIGASGAGKTTMIDILMGLLPPQEGVLLCDKTKITKSNVRSYRANIGYVSQNPYLFSDSVKKNIAFGEKEENINEARVVDALKKAQIYDFFMSKKEGLDSILGENGKKLSGGQKQRIAIARALYIDPEIIVLDEATSALDVETEQEISEAIAALKGQKTIIAIAHRLSTLKKCDKIIYMKEGEIFDIGTFKELHQKHKDFKNLVELSSIKID